MKPYVVAVVGPSGLGKTCLIERLVPALRERGLRVGTIKHAHDRIDLDRPGKDSWRHVRAGATVAAVIGPKQSMVLRPAEMSRGTLARIIDTLSGEVDVMLLEGFHRAPYVQIGVVDRAGKGRHGRRVVAVVTARHAKNLACRFRPRQVSELTAFIEEAWRKQ